MRILICVEGERDSASIRDALCGVDTEGSIAEARDAAAALAELREHEFDCIVVAGSQEIRSLDIVAELRMAGVGTPAIVLTHDEEGARPFALLGAGAAEFLPLTALGSTRFLETLARCVRVARADRRAASASARMHRQSERLLGLARASSELMLADSVERVADIAVAQARELIGAHQAVITVLEPGAPPIRKAAFTAKYAGWRAAPPRWSVPGLEPRAPIERLTQAELELDPRYGKASAGASGRVPSRGWLAATLADRDGERLGALVLSDRTEGDFDEHDEAALLQIAALVSTVIENLRLRAARDARERPEVAERIIDEFLATLSHELRTPLQSMLGWARLLASGTLPPERVARAVEVIERNARAQARMVEDVLDASAIRSGTLRIVRRAVAVGSFVSAAVEHWRSAAEAKSIRLSLVIPDDAGTVLGDPVRLRQAIANLLGNAVEFTPDYGSISVVVSRTEDELNVRVSDSGPGVPPEFLPFVFDRFRQADGSSTRTHRGLGIGLTITRRLVELHGGTVEVESDGSGACFTVSLPVAEEPLVSRDDPGRPLETQSGEFHTRSLQGKRVLLVEDERDTCDLLASVLGEHGAVVATAASAAEGLERMASFQPDLLLSDIGMPGEDGCSFLRRVRADMDKKVSSVLAVALSAYTRLEDRRRALAAGYQLYLTKPVDPATLVRQLGSLLSPTLEKALGA